MSIDTTIPRSARSAGRRVRRAAAAVAAAGLLSAAFGEHADAALEGEHYHDSGSELLTDFCGLDVQHDWEVAGSWTGVAKGPDGLVHYRERAHGSNAFTNVATGKTYSTQWTSNSRDLKLTDNGDGTTTVLIQASGGERWFANGTLVFKNPGTARWEELIDNGGTPADPSDDDFIAYLGEVKPSTGRNDLDGRDFCEDLHIFTT